MKKRKVDHPPLPPKTQWSRGNRYWMDEVDKESYLGLREDKPSDRRIVAAIFCSEWLDFGDLCADKYNAQGFSRSREMADQWRKWGRKRGEL
jgi:hypothetical protein